jgi:hypothetical protein
MTVTINHTDEDIFTTNTVFGVTFYCYMICKLIIK